MKKNETIIKELAELRNELQEQVDKARKRLEEAPEGTVRIAKHRKGGQYYRILESRDHKGTYMHASEKDTAAKLIQKKYDQKFLRAALPQIKAMDEFLKKYDPAALEKLYSSMAAPRKERLSYAVLPDDEYAARWQEQEYEHKTFPEGAPEHFTLKKERVRSKSEVMIANALNAAGIPYRYECPLLLGGVLIHPDFTILRLSDRKEVYWEHFGLLDDTEYRNQALLRVKEYEKAGLYLGDRLIITWETYRVPLNLREIEKKIEHLQIRFS